MTARGRALSVGLAGFAVIGSTLPVALRASASAVPFHDPSATGLITLCGQNGRPVTSGDTRDVPFAWSAVSNSPAPARYAKGLAYLYAFQPLQYVDPGEWSGEAITGGSWFSNTRSPIAEATNRDTPMLWFVQAYPAHWDGYVELRIFYANPGEPPMTSAYPAGIIQVKGYRWTLVQGGTASCKSGTAHTLEAQIQPKADLTTPKVVEVGVAKSGSDPETPNSGQGQGGSASSPGGAAPGSPQPVPSGGRAHAAAASGRLRGESAGGGLPGGAIAGFTAGVVLVFTGVLFVRRTRGRGIIRALRRRT
jgi:hypothetical protein